MYDKYSEQTLGLGSQFLTKQAEETSATGFTLRFESN